MTATLAPTIPATPTANLSICAATDADAPSWDDFVEHHPETRFCHLWGYRRALESYRLHCSYLRFLCGSELVGIFPAVISRGRMTSQPYNEYGGPLFRSLPAEQAAQVAPLLLDFARQNGCHSVEIRGGLGAGWLADSDCCTSNLLQSYGEVSVSTVDNLWKHALDHRARSSVKQAENSGLTARVLAGTAAVSGDFYDLYVRSMKRLAVPPHARSFFNELAEGLGDRLVACFVADNHQTAAILLGGIAANRLHCIVIASDERTWKKRPNDLASWHLMRWAAEQRLAFVDFGSASTPDELRFKKKFGAELRPYWKYILSEKNTPSATPQRREWRISKSLWQSVPLPLTKIAGPLIRRYLL